MLIFIGFLSIIVIELFSSSQLSGFLLNGSLIQYMLAQPQSTNTSIMSSNLEEQNEPEIIHLFGHFANNQIKDGIVTWIQGGLWSLNINNITKSNVNKNSTQTINNNGIANFTANFTMVQPDGSLSHNHNIENFISNEVIITDKDIVVMGVADIYSDNDNNKNNNNNNYNEFKNVPLTIHLMGNKVLGLTMDVSKTEGHFSSSNEMFGTLISGVGLDTSATENSTQTMMHHNTAKNDTVEKESMRMMQH